MRLSLLISQAETAEIVTRLAQKIDHDYQGRSIIVVGILKGSVIFLADLVRTLKTPIERIEFIQLSSYGSGTESSGNVVIQGNLAQSIVQNKEILIVEDIVDSGRSWASLRPQLLALNPQSLKICTLLDKPSRRQVAVPLDYVGRQVEDYFIVGYGFDLNEQYRQLPDIYQWQA
jgi:hypoxanthine phosphoribosyltransferase